MLGTIVNAVAILVGGTIGLLLNNGLSKRYRDIIMQVLPLAVMFMGLTSAVSGLMQKETKPLLFVISLVVGSVFGEWLDIEGKLQALGEKMQSYFGKEESSLAEGFVTTSLIFCVGTMAILGSLESGIQKVHTTLFVKSVLDGTSSIIFASTMGVGVLLSAIPVFLYQGSLTLLASTIEPFLTADMMREINIVGGIMIFALSINMLGLAKMKVGNMLPSVLVPVIYFSPVVQQLLEKLMGLF